MSVKETINTVFAKLPFKALAEKIPAGTRAKVPLLDKAIPFANQIVCGLAVVLLVTVIACSGKGGSSGSGSSSRGEIKFTMASESDFDVTLAPDGTTIIEKYKGTGGAIAIPATIQGVQVTQIGKVTGDYVGQVGNVLFGNNYLRIGGIQLPEGLKVIGTAAFSFMNFSTIIIPDSVTVFGEEIFHKSRLTSFTFPAGLIASKRIPNCMFWESDLSGSLVIPEGIETIGMQAFSSCKNLTSVTLPSTIKSIEFMAFYACSNLTEVIIPTSVTRIQWGRQLTFNNCPNMTLASQARLKELGYTDSFK